MRGVNPKWIKSKVSEIDAGIFVSAITGYNPAAQWLISFLSKKDLPAKVTSLGAGVKRITLEKHICQTCQGKGFVNKDKS